MLVAKLNFIATETLPGFSVTEPEEHANLFTSTEPVPDQPIIATETLLPELATSTEPVSEEPITLANHARRGSYYK